MLAWWYTLKVSQSSRVTLATTKFRCHLVDDGFSKYFINEIHIKFDVVPKTHACSGQETS